MPFCDSRTFFQLIRILIASIPVLFFSQAFAQSSKQETTVTRGVGFRQSNKFEFKYKERIKTYEEQIEMGLKRGWLSTQDAKTFSLRLDDLKKMEASVSANGYPKPELDNLELEITKFNREFSNAGQKTTSPKVDSGSSTPVKSPTTAKSSKMKQNEQNAVKKTTKKK